MFKDSRPQENRALENEEKPSEFGLRVELAGYWSRLLLRVKKQSEVVDQEQNAKEVRS